MKVFFFFSFFFSKIDSSNGNPVAQMVSIDSTLYLIKTLFQAKKKMIVVVTFKREKYRGTSCYN